MIPADFIEDIKKYGSFSAKGLRNGYVEISTPFSGTVAVSPKEFKELVMMNFGGRDGIFPFGDDGTAEANSTRENGAADTPFFI
jgi:hypothetical protein